MGVVRGVVGELGKAGVKGVVELGAPSDLHHQFELHGLGGVVLVPWSAVGWDLVGICGGDMVVG